MRGHQPLIAIRMRGKCPASAAVTVGTDPLRLWQDWPAVSPAIAQIEVQDQDRLTSLAPELRCIVGMLVEVSGIDRDRTEAVAQAAMEAGAKRVFVYTHHPKTHAVEHAAFITEDMQQWQQF